jgi:hypothetical protein
LWDIQNSHSTILSLPADGHPFFVNGQAPAEYTDIQRNTTPGGLDLIMRRIGTAYQCYYPREYWISGVN